MIKGYYLEPHRFTLDSHLFKISSYNPQVVTLIWPCQGVYTVYREDKGHILSSFTSLSAIFSKLIKSTNRTLQNVVGFGKSTTVLWKRL